MGAQKTTSIGSKILLSIIGSPLALRRMRGPSICLTEWINSKDDYISILANGLVNPLGL